MIGEYLNSKKVTLVIIFNQDFSKNINKLEAIYSKRFSTIHYIVPSHFSRLHKHYVNDQLSANVVYFADKVINKLRLINKKQAPNSVIGQLESTGYADRVSSVIGNQFYFYHFIFQASDQILKNDSDWFWFVGDDAILNSHIDETNILENLNAANDCDAVICKPVISDDAWLKRISFSQDLAQKKLTNLIGTDKPYHNKLHVEKENVNSTNETVCVSCADFFGIRRDVLIKALPYFKKAFANRMYVEMAVANILLHVSKKPKAIDNFEWVSQPTKQQINTMIKKVHDKETIFVHPIKLSQLSDREVEQLS